MDLIIALIVLILIVILFNKVAQLKKMIDFQDLKIKNLQEQLQKQSTTTVKQPEIVRPEIHQPKVEEPIREKVVRKLNLNPFCRTK